MSRAMAPLSSWWTVPWARGGRAPSRSSPISLGGSSPSTPTAVAPTLAYDHAGIMGEHGTIPAARAARVRVPTLVITGGNGAPFMLETAKTLRNSIPDARLVTLPGQTHDVQPEALAPALVEFF